MSKMVRKRLFVVASLVTLSVRRKPILPRVRRFRHLSQDELYERIPIAVNNVIFFNQKSKVCGIASFHVASEKSEENSLTDRKILNRIRFGKLENGSKYFPIFGFLSHGN